jgi:hypothetical protein
VRDWTSDQQHREQVVREKEVTQGVDSGRRKVWRLTCIFGHQVTPPMPSKDWIHQSLNSILSFLLIPIPHHPNLPSSDFCLIDTMLSDDRCCPEILRKDLVESLYNHLRVRQIGSCYNQLSFLHLSPKKKKNLGLQT